MSVLARMEAMTVAITEPAPILPDHIPVPANQDSQEMELTALVYPLTHTLKQTARGELFNLS
jgi:hypothetical protein